MDPLELASLQLTAGDLAPEELPMLAANALAEGRDSPALREAAGEPLADLDKVRSTFRQAMSELGYQDLTKEEAWWKLAHWKAAQIVAGEVEEYEGARWLGYSARDGLRYAGDLLVFAGIESCWESDRAHGEDYANDVVEAARKLVERNRPYPRRWIRLLPRLQAPVFDEHLIDATRTGGWTLVLTEETPLTAGLVADIALWAELVKDKLDDRMQPTFETTADAEAFVKRGHELASRSQSELGDDWVVVFYPPPTRPGGKNWEDQ